MKSDQNFDSHSKTFGKNIYGTSKGKVRQAIMLRDLNEYLIGKPQLNILDVGGGQGQVALELAKLGHNVTITDLSSDMLDVAQATAEQMGLTNVEYIHSPLQELDSILTAKYDLVLCHAVFEWLEHPKLALKTLSDLCRKGGAISLMFFNLSGQVFSNLVYGNFEYIKNGLKVKKVVKLNPQSALDQNDVQTWARDLKLELIMKSGVRCFHDYMRDIKMWQEKFDDIVQMEMAYSRQEPYASIARYIHLLLRK